MPENTQAILRITNGPPVIREQIVIDLHSRLEYDTNFLRDRLVVTARTEDRMGYSTTALAPGFLEEHRHDALSALGDHLPNMRRVAIDGALDLGYEAELRRLRSIMREMSDNIDDLSRPWHRKFRDAVARWWEGRAR